MAQPSRPRVTILVAEDDDQEFELMKVAFGEARLLHCLVRVKNGVEALAYLRGEPCEAETGEGDLPYNKDCPAVVLLDLNMPKMDGRETLQHLKGKPELKRVPVIILTNSSREEDVIRSYELGANAFLRKPMKFAEFVTVMNAFKLFWLDIVSLPPRPKT